MEEIIVKISKKGNFDIKMEGVNFMGGECVNKMDKLVELLGMNCIETEQKTDDVMNISVIGAGRK